MGFKNYTAIRFFRFLNGKFKMWSKMVHFKCIFLPFEYWSTKCLVSGCFCNCYVWHLDPQLCRGDLISRLIWFNFHKSQKSSVLNPPKSSVWVLWNGPQGLVLSTKIQVLRNFLTKIWEFWTPKFFQKIWEIFRQNILMQLAGQIFENFSQNILIGTQIENLRKLSEFWEFCQNSDNFFVEPMFYAIKIYATKILPLKKLSVTFLQLRQCE